MVSDRTHPLLQMAGTGSSGRHGSPMVGDSHSMTQEDSSCSATLGFRRPVQLREPPPRRTRRNQRPAETTLFRQRRTTMAPRAMAGGPSARAQVRNDPPSRRRATCWTSPVCRHRCETLRGDVVFESHSPVSPHTGPEPRHGRARRCIGTATKHCAGPGRPRDRAPQSSRSRARKVRPQQIVMRRIATVGTVSVRVCAGWLAGDRRGD